MSFKDLVKNGNIGFSKVASRRAADIGISDDEYDNLVKEAFFKTLGKVLKEAPGMAGHFVGRGGRFVDDGARGIHNYIKKGREATSNFFRDVGNHVTQNMEQGFNHADYKAMADIEAEAARKAQKADHGITQSAGKSEANAASGAAPSPDTPPPNAGRPQPEGAPPPQQPQPQAQPQPQPQEAPPTFPTPPSSQPDGSQQGSQEGWNGMWNNLKTQAQAAKPYAQGAAAGTAAGVAGGAYLASPKYQAPPRGYYGPYGNGRW